MKEHAEFAHPNAAGTSSTIQPAFNVGAATVFACGILLLVIALLMVVGTGRSEEIYLSFFVATIATGLSVLGGIVLAVKPFVVPPQAVPPKLEPGLANHLRQIVASDSVDSRIIRFAGLIEFILHETTADSSNATLGEMVQSCAILQKDGCLRDVNFALGVRNSIAHPSRDNQPTSDEKDRASNYLNYAATLLVEKNPYLFM